MQINIYKDPMQKARLFGAPVLYSAENIPREDVPEGWFCYDLRGTAQDKDRPYSLVDRAEKKRAASVLSYLPLKKGRAQNRLVRDMFQLDSVSISLKEFCAGEKIRCPETPLRHLLRPAFPEEAGFSMPKRRRRMKRWAPSAMSELISDAAEKNSITAGSPDSPTATTGM